MHVEVLSIQIQVHDLLDEIEPKCRYILTVGFSLHVINCIKNTAFLLVTYIQRALSHLCCIGVHLVFEYMIMHVQRKQTFSVDSPNLAVFTYKCMYLYAKGYSTIDTLSVH
jgi:hypothetical protein